MEFFSMLSRVRMRHLMAGLVSFIAMTFAAAVCSYDITQQSIRVPINDLSGHHRFMSGYICRPSGTEHPGLVVVNHGSTTIASDRRWMPLASCNNEAVRWFTDRHYAVVQAWRLGYGPDGGSSTENFVHCTTASYYKAGMETARQIDAIVDYALALPDVDPHGVVVIGHSGGGWGTIADDSRPHPNVAAFINMAGGRGGHYHLKADSNCGADQLVEAARLFAKTSSKRMLWIYADNDSFFGPRLVNKMATAYASAGGKLQIDKPHSHEADGHSLFFDTGGSQVWGPLVQKYLDSENASATNPRK